MVAFEKARELFNSYQESGRLNKLRDSLDILDQIIQGQGADLQRAINLKQVIGRHIDAQIDGIAAKANIDEFRKYLKDDEGVSFLSEALNEKDLANFAKLLSIKNDYFG